MSIDRGNFQLNGNNSVALSSLCLGLIISQLHRRAGYKSRCGATQVNLGALTVRRHRQLDLVRCHHTGSLYLPGAVGLAHVYGDLGFIRRYRNAGQAQLFGDLEFVNLAGKIALAGTIVFSYLYGEVAGITDREFAGVQIHILLI